MSIALTLQILRFSRIHRSGVILSTPRSPTTFVRGARKAPGTLARSGRRLRTCALLAGNGLRVDEGRELVLELLDSAGTPALGQIDRHRVGKDLLFTTL